MGCDKDKVDWLGFALIAGVVACLMASVIWWVGWMGKNAFATNSGQALFALGAVIVFVSAVWLGDEFRLLPEESDQEKPDAQENP